MSEEYLDTFSESYGKEILAVDVSIFFLIVSLQCLVRLKKVLFGTLCVICIVSTKDAESIIMRNPVLYV